MTDEVKDQPWTWELGLRPDLSAIEPGSTRQVSLHIRGEGGESLIEFLELSSIVPLPSEINLETRTVGLGQLVTGKHVECEFIFNDGELSQRVIITEFSPSATKT